LIQGMPRPRPPYLLRQVTQHGRVCWYVRKGKGKRIRVPTPGTEGFDQAYQAALADSVTCEANVRPNAAGMLAWLVTRYRETMAWTSLSLATRRQRENILKHVLETAGNQLASRITKASIIAGKDRRSGHQARHFLDTMRGLFKWAADAGLVKDDPTDRVKVVKTKIKGFPPWDEEDVAAYRNRWPIGTRQRVWLEVLIGTGLRRGDAVMLGKQHVRDGIATIKTEKTNTEVPIPISPQLAETLVAGPTGDLHFICNALGKPSQRRASATLLPRPVVRPASKSQRMGSASTKPPLRLTKAPPSQSLMRCLAGPAAAWQHITLARQAVVVWQ
jgi:hypothetical protein